MASIAELIQREINPFDANLKLGNFWNPQQPVSQMVNSIHQAEVDAIERVLDQVASDHVSRAILLLGDPGSGKTHVLTRLRQTFNSKAFFAYIGPWSDTDYIWRHTLRYTVDSLMQIPEGQTESQLILWLKSLSALTQRNLKQRVAEDHFWQVFQSDRARFIAYLKQAYKSANLYNPDNFFGVLHALMSPQTYDIACQWLKGDDLSEEAMKELGVKTCIDSEHAARYLLSNLGRISTQTWPIVLCFDNLDNIPRLDGIQDIQPLFNVNSVIQNDGLKNFLVIFSFVTNTWRRNSDRVVPADKVVFKDIRLKPICIEQAAALWLYRLAPLHQVAQPKPHCALFPLQRELLRQTFPSGKMFPRQALILARDEYQRFKLQYQHQHVSPTSSIPNSSQPSQPSQPQPSQPSQPPQPSSVSSHDRAIAEFQLIWQQEYKTVQSKVKKVSAFSAPELIRLISEAMAALQVQGVKPKLLKGTNAEHSLKYQVGKKTVGLVWNEDANMTTFFHVMSACQKAIGQSCDRLQLIRDASVGDAKKKSHLIYRQLFVETQNVHLKPTLTTVHILETYHRLVNAVAGKELIVNGETISRSELERLARESGVLAECQLLQDLGLVEKPAPASATNVSSAKQTPELVVDSSVKLIEKQIMSVMVTQQMVGRKALINTVVAQLSDVDDTAVDAVIQRLCRAQKIQISNPKDKLDSQILYLLP